MTWISSLVSGFISWINPLVTAMFCMMKQVWCWAVNLLFDMVEPLIVMLVTAFPDLGNVDWSWTVDYYYTVDQWLPLTEMITGYLSYMTFYLFFIGVRFCYRFVPFMG